MLLRTAAVALAALAASGLLLAPAAQASSRPVQVNGNQLKSALLPASAFGSGYQAGPSSGSGGTLFNLPAEDRISRMSCGTFEDLAGLGNFGQTAFASGYINNPNAFGGDYPNTVDNFDQSVDQRRQRQGGQLVLRSGLRQIRQVQGLHRIGARGPESRRRFVGDHGSVLLEDERR